MEVDETESEPNILYELLTLAEWHQNSDIGLQKVCSSHSILNPSLYFNPWRIFEKSKLDNKKFLQTEYAWQLAVSQDGKVIAIVQESLVEIRTAKDEFSAVVGKAPIPTDQYPQLRKVLWSTDNTFLAVARDNGVVTIFNLLGSVIATIQPFESNGNVHGNNACVIKPVVGLLFLQPKLKSTKWSNELFAFYNDGQVRSILLSSLDGCDSEENANCSLEHYFPQGMTSVASHSLHHTVVIAGNSPSKRDGMSVWRVLNDYPYLKIASGFEKDIPVGRSFLRFFQGYSLKLNESTVIKMRISPKGDVLACLHYSGDISLWQYPGIRLIRRWSLSQQPNYSKINPRNEDNVKNEGNFHPVDICWWSDTALVVARKTGAITVCSLTTLDNLLGESPEFFSCSPQISSVYGSRSTVLALECETENNKYRMRDILEDIENENETSGLQASIQAALYSFTDIERFEPKRKTPRPMQRTYRLFALKYTTPEELYMRKIELEDYDSALSLAHTYDLDCDLVYQKQWKSNSVSKESIYNYLDKIKNTYWVINECIRRVPDTIESAKELLEFGLKKTEIDRESLNTSDSAQNKLVFLRRQILSFLDNLSLYQKIINNPSKYSAAEYDNFRRKCPLFNTIDLARQENWLGVSIMFTYAGNVVLKYWLPILSNFPETLSPLHYRSLLPEVNNNEVVVWDTQQLRNQDWSEDRRYEDSISEAEVYNDFIYQDDVTLKKFEADILTPSLVEEWYLKRTYEIEKNTGLVENALLLATLGKERNVKSLDAILFHLRTLYTLVYVVQYEEITLSKLETLPVLQQAKLFLSKTNRETFVRDLNNLIHPFVNHCGSRTIVRLYPMVRGLLLWLSEEDLELPLEFFTATKEENNLSFKLSMIEIMSLALDCVYNCKAANQLENGYLILECLPTRIASETSDEIELHDKIDRMENHLEVCDILQQYRIYKTPKWVVDHVGDKTVGTKIMETMANHTLEVTLEFGDLEIDLRRLQLLMFKNIDSQFCFELVASTQMNSQDEDIISSAAFLLQCARDERNKVIPFERSVDLVVKAARLHFERATSSENYAIKLSQVCLNLINEPHPLVCEELDLIESIRILQDFDVKLLPIQVRKCRKEMTLIEHCLERKPLAYKSSQRLIQLAHALRIYGYDRKGRECEVLTLLAKYALKIGDYEYCHELCTRLVYKNYASAWSVVLALAREYENLTSNVRKEYVAFAIMHCPKEDLQSLVDYRRSIK